MKKYTVLLITFLLITGIKATSLASPSFLNFALATWSAKVIPQGLIVHGVNFLNKKHYFLGRGEKTQFADPVIIEQTTTSATLSYPLQHLTVKIEAIQNRLHFTFTSAVEQKLTWPILAEEPQTQAIIYPEGEGLYIPLRDKFWHKRLNKTSLSTQGDGQGLSAPFWGYDLGTPIMD